MIQAEDALRRIGAGDRLAFANLYTELQPALQRYAASILAGDIDAAADVVDEAFLDIWRHAGRYEGSGNATGWIYRIVRNKAVDWLRSRRERPIAAADGDHGLENLVDDADTPEQALEKKSDALELRAALERLTPDHRDVVWLCYFESRSVSEIAVLVDCPENTVKTRLFHARKQLRSMLGGVAI